MFALLFGMALLGDPADETLICKVLDGHRGMGRILARRLVPVLRARVGNYLRRRGGRIGASDVDDMTQEIWLRLLQDEGKLLRAFDAERGMTLEGYVGMVCRRELWLTARASSRQKRGGHLALVELDDARDAVNQSPSPEAVAVGQDLLDGLVSRLESELPERGRLVLKASYVDQMGPAEIARMMGVNTQVVYNWLHKIRGLARRFFTESGVSI